MRGKALRPGENLQKKRQAFRLALHRAGGCDLAEAHQVHDHPGTSNHCSPAHFGSHGPSRPSKERSSSRQPSHTFFFQGSGVDTTGHFPATANKTWHLGVEKGHQPSSDPMDDTPPGGPSETAGTPSSAPGSAFSAVAAGASIAAAAAPALCAVHCAAMPVITLALPSLQLARGVCMHKVARRLAIYCVVPLGLVSNAVGYPMHQSATVTASSLAGVSCVTAAATVAHFAPQRNVLNIVGCGLMLGASYRGRQIEQEQGMGCCSDC